MKHAMVLILLTLSACHKPPPPPLTASQVMDQCKLSGYGKDPSPYSDGTATPAYLVICMGASGWAMRSSEDCMPKAKVENGRLVDNVRWDDASCYRPRDRISN